MSQVAPRVFIKVTIFKNSSITFFTSGENKI